MCYIWYWRFGETSWRRVRYQYRIRKEAEGRPVSTWHDRSINESVFNRLSTYRAEVEILEDREMQDFRIFLGSITEAEQWLFSLSPKMFILFGPEVEIWSILTLCTCKTWMSKCLTGLIWPTLMWSSLNFSLAQWLCGKQLAGHWLGVSPSGTALSVRKETFSFTFVSAPHLRRDFLTPRPSPISRISLRSLQL